MHRGDGDDAGDGDDQAAVLLDALDDAFAAGEGAFGDADSLACVVFGVVGAEHFEGVGAGAGDEDEGAHLIFADGGGNVHILRLAVEGAGAQLLAGVDGELDFVGQGVAVDGCQTGFGTAHEQKGGHQRLALGVEGAVGVTTFAGEPALQGEDLVVEHFECVPVVSLRHSRFLPFQKEAQIW